MPTDKELKKLLWFENKNCKKCKGSGWVKGMFFKKSSCECNCHYKNLYPNYTCE